MKKVTFTTKSNVIYQEIKNAILDSTYKPNQKIIISDVAKQFGTSASPVREAMKQLESERLLKFTPHVGAVVADINSKELGNTFDLWKVLEGWAVRYAANHITEEDLTLLKKNAEDMKKAVDKGDHQKMAFFNEEFHGIICSICRNQYFTMIDTELINQYYTIHGIFKTLPNFGLKVYRGHKGIVNALLKKDPDLAENSVIKHMEEVRKSLQPYFDSIS